MLLILGGSTLMGIAHADPRDEYQVVENETQIKTYLLRRIANDPKTLNDPPFDDITYLPDRVNQYPAREPLGDAEGKLFLVEDSAELNQVFQNVGKRIKVRLID